MAWCVANRIDFVFGLARNARLVREIYVELANAEEESWRTGPPARRYKDFLYATLDGWSLRCRVIAKAEWTQGDPNPRFIVTSLGQAETSGRVLYEKVYCARGDMENRIKECQAICSLTGPRPQRGGPGSYGSGSPRSPTFSFARSGASARSLPRPHAARSGSSSSSSPASCASARAGSNPRSPLPILTLTNGASPLAASP
jgi:hypothetical protein